MGHILQDLRHAVRQLVRAPGFTAIAVFTLAIGMGVNAVAFSVVNGLLFRGTMARGLPGVGRIATTPGDDEGGYASLLEMERFTGATQGALEIAAEGRASLAWRHDGTTDTAWVLYVTDNYFSLVSAPVRLGQLRVERGIGGPPTAVVGERFWRERLGSADLPGLTLRLGDRDVAVAGVVAETFTGPAGIYSPDVWLPLDDLALFSPSPTARRPETRWLFVLGRLRAGASPAQVQGQVDTAVADMAREWPDTHARRGATFRMLDHGNSELRGLRTGAAIGMAIIGVVLLLACFNVANLLLARAVERERDSGIRTALGAGPGRLVRLVMAEGAVIALLAGTATLLVAWWTRSIVGSFAMPIDQPQYLDLTPDATVMAFIGVLVIVAAVLPGVFPAVSAARVDVLRVLGSQGGSPTARGPAGLGRSLVALQVAGSTAFLALAALLLQSHAHLSVTDLGFDRERLVVAEVEPAAHGLDGERARPYVDALQARARALPGATAITPADRAPFFIGFDRTSMVWPVSGTCDAGACTASPVYAVDPHYFRTLGIAMTEGRGFVPGDTSGAVVVNAALARQHWPRGGAVGQTLRLGDAGTPATVIGVAADAHMRGLDRPVPTVYRPLAPADLEGPLTLVARTEGPPSMLVRPLREAALAVDPNVPVAVRTMSERAAVQLWPFRTVSVMFTICGTLALVLATIGLASIVIHAVNRRMREFGVRVSIGATRRDLVRDVLQSGVGLLVPGLAIGLAGAAGLARLAQVAFVGVNVLDPVTYAGVAILQCVIVLLACLGPAFKASRVDPLTALRSE